MSLLLMLQLVLLLLHVAAHHSSCSLQNLLCRSVFQLQLSSFNVIISPTAATNMPKNSD
jgi:hypothetical protein